MAQFMCASFFTHPRLILHTAAAVDKVIHDDDDDDDDDVRFRKRCRSRMYSLCICVLCVFFPFILDVRIVGRTTRGSHRSKVTQKEDFSSTLLLRCLP